ncbi:hypothetical protein MLD38_030086 [Melastoma candidum]|uniref:Uncharacterized protein n=1 Tax=Melastoma candidum TaxID=119954 RepID=A0ACB9ML71_9MYRT|nr:hypothetical protein MLD38_030086 [Melastoma candidum]
MLEDVGGRLGLSLSGLATLEEDGTAAAGSAVNGFAVDRRSDLEVGAEDGFGWAAVITVTARAGRRDPVGVAIIDAALGVAYVRRRRGRREVGDWLERSSSLSPWSAGRRVMTPLRLVAAVLVLKVSRVDSFLMKIQGSSVEICKILRSSLSYGPVIAIFINIYDCLREIQDVKREKNSRVHSRGSQ